MKGKRGKPKLGRGPEHRLIRQVDDRSHIRLRSKRAKARLRGHSHIDRPTVMSGRRLAHRPRNLLLPTAEDDTRDPALTIEVIESIANNGRMMLPVNESNNRTLAHVGIVNQSRRANQRDGKRLWKGNAYRAGGAGSVLGRGRVAKASEPARRR